MREFSIRAKIEPAYPFGLPTGRMKLRPSDRDLRVLCEGLSADESFPRPQSHAIHMAGLVGGLPATIEDNIVTVRVTASDQSTAKEAAERALAKYVRGLILERGYEFFATVTQITDEETRETLPISVTRGDASGTYSLAKQRRAVSRAIEMSSCDDPILQKALVYMEQSQVLMNQAHFHPHLSSKAFLIAPAFLSAWKALTVVLGDPSSDRDYQRRFRAFGFPKGFWDDRVRPLKDVRDKMDVAHYSLDEGIEKEIRAAFWDAERVTREVVRAYFRTVC